MGIISASRRTDIPAFYSTWLLNRLRAGFCHWINPFGGKVSRVSLRPEDVLAIVFWTRNPKPLLPHLADLRQRGYRFYFHVTINGYPRAIEPYSPPPAEAVAAFQRLSDAISPGLALWRYDPILLSSLTPPAYHIAQFDLLSRQLQGYTTRCYLSFVVFYGKTERNITGVARANALTVQRPLASDQRELVQALSQIAAQRGITLYSCCGKELVGAGQPPYSPALGGTAGTLLAPTREPGGEGDQPPYPPTLGGTAGTLFPPISGPGGNDQHPQNWGPGGSVQQAHCVDLDLVRQVRGDAALAVKAAPSRQDCGCVASTDIGAYDTCIYGCTYCYATNSREAAMQRLRQHDPDDTLLWRPPSLRGADLSAA